MHILRVEQHSIDGAAEAVDLDQSPADIVALSFTDTDLSVLAVAWEASPATLPTLRLANLGALRHPYSVDLYVEKVLSKSRFVLVRLLGGMDYWRYGVDELAALARSHRIQLAIVPGDHQWNARLDDASTVAPEVQRRIWSYFAAGGVENGGACLNFVAGLISPATTPCHLATRITGDDAGEARRGLNSASFEDQTQSRRLEPVAPIPPFGTFAAAERPGEPGSPLALIVLYRAWMLAADTAPVVAQADALASRGFRVAAVFVTSLKDNEVVVPLRDLLATRRPGVILNMTAFSARLGEGGSVLDEANAPVLQLALSGGSRQQWSNSPRGLGPADLAMHVVLPEFDGRIVVGAISFKGETTRNPALEFTRLVHQPEPHGISHAADLARAWADLGRTPRAKRRLACVLSDYPAKGGRTGYAVGLDTPRSVVAIAERLAREGFAVEPPGNAASLMTALSDDAPRAVLSVAEYEQLLGSLPPEFIARVRATWGEAGDDASVQEFTARDRTFRHTNDTVRPCGVCEPAFCFRIVRAGDLLIAVQPDRGSQSARKAEYHDANLPPRHGYVAFYLWLRMTERAHAIIHCGTHGTLEWLPGNAVALSDTCAPRAVLGAVPVIYPFIVNNPGEAAQAKRRIAAVTIGHLTPPLMAAGSHGVAAELEGLFDEYAEAQSLDPRRATRLAELIIARARETGLAADSGIAPDADPREALVRLDAWLCDLKDMRIGDGLHVFGQTPDAERLADGVRSLASIGGLDEVEVERRMGACAEAEMRGLLRALDGRFVPPGPAGAPDRGNLDVLPTGRNLYSVDPRSIPTRTAWEIGRRTAEEMLTRHAQDHGEWPRSVVLDIWGSATMRTGGDDLAQAMALLGVRPRWDEGSSRVAGFDVLPLAILNRPRVDVTLRMSGLFRDVFPAQIAMFADIVRAVAALDEAPEDNPLAASVRSGDGEAGHRIFGAAPGAYGIGLSRVLTEGDWQDRDTLGQSYLRATSHAYGVNAEGVPAAPAFQARVAAADAYLHVQDLPGQDILSADAFAEHGGGFAAAAASMGHHPALYHVDTTQPERSRVRTLREEVARVARARASNPRWLTGQMRHGFRGAMEIAETVDNFFAYAALTDATTDQQFDLLFDATIGDETVRGFLIDANPAAATTIAERFDEAIRRSLWTTRRNSAGTITADLRAMVSEGVGLDFPAPDTTEREPNGPRPDRRVPTRTDHGHGDPALFGGGPREPNPSPPRPGHQQERTDNTNVSPDLGQAQRTREARGELARASPDANAVRVGPGRSAELIRGWCPGALRPMRSGDGLIVRLKPDCGIVELGFAAAIARWSRQWGNGQIELTNRGNLQLRGLTEQHLPPLYDALLEWNALDANPAGEAVRNVISSALTGLDPTAVLDARPIARALGQCLSGDPDLHGLPGKFSFAIDDGGELGLGDVPADIRFKAFIGNERPEFAIGLGGSCDVARCQPSSLVQVASALCQVLLDTSSQHRNIRRMRDLVAARGAEAIARDAGLAPSDSTQPAPRRERSTRYLGVQPLGSAAFLGVGLPFGRIGSEDLANLVTEAETAGASEFRLTPWRAVLVPVRSTNAAREMLAGLAERAFIFDPHDPRRRVAACPGGPACAHGTTPTRDDATTFAAMFAGATGSDIRLHVSGCEKGCAHSRQAPITLVARNGHYDLVRNGAASDTPIARDLTLSRAMDAVTHILGAPA